MKPAVPPLAESDPPIEGPEESPRFGRFTVLGRLGAGAMGVVYAAYDPTLDRRVALKVLRGAANRGRARERTRREALALARISHPNVVSLYEVGEADGRLFLAMEYVDGVTLDAWLAAEPRDWHTVVELFGALARGLAVAHEAGLVHRDFKPANVLVDRRGRPVIIDFGLALLADDETAQAASVAVEDPADDAPNAPDGLVRLTRTGRLRGTPAYMAPEVMAGGEHSRASDQFALCVALFEALFGLPPFPLDDLRSLTHARATGAITEPPTGAGGAQVPPGVAAIVRRGLAPQPAERFPDLPTLARALAAYDAATADREMGHRIRQMLGLVALLAMIGMAALLSGTGAFDDPRIFIRVSWVAPSFFVITLLLIRRVDASLLNRALYVAISTAMVAKQIGLLAGYAMGMTVPQLLMLDAVVLAGGLVAAGLALRLNTTPWSALAAGAAVALMGLRPSWAFALHDVALLLVVGGLIYDDRRRRSAA